MSSSTTSCPLSPRTPARFAATTATDSSSCTGVGLPPSRYLPAARCSRADGSPGELRGLTSTAVDVIDLWVVVPFRELRPTQLAVSRPTIGSTEPQRLCEAAAAGITGVQG